MSIMSRRRRLLKNRIRFLKTGRAADFAFLRYVRLVDLIAFVIGIFMAPLGAVGRPRQPPQNLAAWLVRGFLPVGQKRTFPCV